MRALVTGAGGFVGQHLLDHLREAGDDVVATDRSLGGPDLADIDAWNALLADSAPDVLYHLAGDADVGGSWNHPADTFRTNAEGTLTVLSAARAAGVGRVVCIGSADVYGRVRPEALPIGEDHPLEPVSPYAVSKVAAEFVALQQHLGYELDVVRVRPFNHIGPGQSERFVAPAIAMRIARNELSGERVVTVGNVTPRRDLTDVRDVVRAYRLLAEKGESGEVYNVCSGRALAISEMCQVLLQHSAHPMELAPDPDLQRPVDIPVLVGDHSRLTGATGWAPEIPIETTLSDLMADCRQRLAEVAADGSVS